SWALNDEQRDLLLRLTPAAFNEEQSDWAMTLADAYLVEGKLREARKYAEQAQTAYQERIRRTPSQPGLLFFRACALAILGRSGEAIAEGTRALELSKDLQARARGLIG